MGSNGAKSVQCSYRKLLFYMFSEYGRQLICKNLKCAEMSEFPRKATKSGISVTEAIEMLECIFKSDLKHFGKCFLLNRNHNVLSTMT